MAIKPVEHNKLTTKKLISRPLIGAPEALQINAQVKSNLKTKISKL